MAERPIETINPSNVADAIREKAGVGFSEPTFESWRYNAPAAEGAMVFPKGRRKMRMEAEFQKFQQQELAMQQAIQAMEIERMQEERLQRAQNFDLENAKTAEEREARVMNEAGAMINSIRGAVAPDGTIISNPIRPEDPDAIERLDNLARDFKFGIENKAAASMFERLYTDALKFREDKINQSKQQELAAINLSVRTGKPFEEFGTYDERGMFQPKLQGMITGAEEVKAAEEKKAQEAAISTEKRRAETTADVAEERDKKTRRRQLDEDILTEEQILIDYQNQKESPSRDVEIKKSRAKLLNLGLKRAAIDDLVFKDPDAYKKALEEGRKIPSGTTIYIGTKPVKVK